MWCLDSACSAGKAFPEQQRHSKCLPPFWYEARKVMGSVRGKEKKGNLLKTTGHMGGNSKERSWQVGV